MHDFHKPEDDQYIDDSDIIDDLGIDSGDENVTPLIAVVAGDEAEEVVTDLEEDDDIEIYDNHIGDGIGVDEEDDDDDADDDDDEDDDNDDSFDENEDSDDDTSDNDVPASGASTARARDMARRSVRSSSSRQPQETNNDDNDYEGGGGGEEEEEDEVVQAIIAASKVKRVHPPDINIEDFVVDLSFHPEEDILAVGTLAGDVLIYKYTNEENTLLNTIEVHTKAVRAIDFNADGSTLFSTSKDKTIMLSDIQTGKLKRFYNQAHEAPLYSMKVLDENLFATGDEDGTLKLWDLRTPGNKPIFGLKEVDDCITSILTNSAKKMLLTTSGDGYLTAINIGARKLYVQSEPYNEELTCMGLFRSESKLVVGSSKGRFYNFNWNEFGVHNTMYPGPKSPISLMLPITERICIVGGEEGILRAIHVLPGRNLGIVGQHSLGVEAIDICNTGEFVASSSHDNDIKFWNIKYFEEFPDIKYNEKHNKKKDLRHNFPSSKQGNAGDFFADLNT